MGEERKLEGRDEGDWQCSSSSHSHWPEEEQILALAPCSRSARSGPEDVRVLMKTSGCEERRILGSQVQGQEGFWRGRVSFGRSRDVMARGRGGGVVVWLVRGFKKSTMCTLTSFPLLALFHHVRPFFRKTPRSFLAVLLSYCAKGCQRLNKINKQ